MKVLLENYRVSNKYPQTHAQRETLAEQAIQISQLKYNILLINTCLFLLPLWQLTTSHSPSLFLSGFFKMNTQMKFLYTLL